MRWNQPIHGYRYVLFNLQTRRYVLTGRGDRERTAYTRDYFRRPLRIGGGRGRRA
ncbi:hypothetical protein [Nannocystis sp.]|uniref:hypothetical protein n=1 Tax=Nannocystis sp. TaxID=1962667 RepID=UPI0025D47C1D|nr:hypothetical protein [Nannocystis sp.]MBK7828619.1 hypothetical protein [Nannocystis sp.]